MTKVCLVGADDVELRYELLSRETSREALSTYDLRAPYANSIEIETVSLGAAVSLLNDLNWYLVRFVEDAMVLEPSVSDVEWLSRDLATAVRDDEIAPAETGRHLKVYGVVRGDGSPDGNETETDSESVGEAGPPNGEDEPEPPATPVADDADRTSSPPADTGSGGPLPHLVEPMYVARTGETLPEYDLRPVDDTLRVRLTESEFEA